MELPEKTYKSFRHIVSLVTFYNISSFYFGYTIVYFNSIPYQVIHSLFAIPIESSLAEGILSASIPFGAIFGAYLNTYIIHFFSRKHSFYFINLVTMISGLIVLIQNPYTLIVGRIGQGACVGAYSGLVPMMVKQVSPVEISGAMGAFKNAFIIFGFLIGFLLSYILSHFYEPTSYWFVTFSFTLLTTLLQQILFFSCFSNQTPKYLLLKGRHNEAKQLIREIYLPEYQENVYEQKIKDLQSDIELEEGNQREYPPDHPKAIFIAVFLAIFQQLSGISVVLVYGAQIARAFLPKDPLLFPVLANAYRLMVSFLAIYLLKEFGRKRLLMIGTAVLALSLLGIFVGFQKSNKLVIASICIYLLAFVCSFGPIMWLYIAQVLQPPNIPIAVSINWLSNTALVVSFPVIRASCGESQCPQFFLACSICMVLSLLICYFVMVETKGKTELEIRQQFNTNEIKICC